MVFVLKSAKSTKALIFQFLILEMYSITWGTPRYKDYSSGTSTSASGASSTSRDASFHAKETFPGKL